MKKKTIAALTIGGALLLGPLAGMAAAHTSSGSKTALTDHCIVIPLGSTGAEITLCVPT